MHSVGSRIAKPVKAISLFLKTIITQLAANIGDNQKCEGETTSQTNEINDRIGFVFYNISIGGLKEVFQHSR